jgi:beta-lactamase class A
MHSRTRLTLCAVAAALALPALIEARAGSLDRLRARIAAAARAAEGPVGVAVKHLESGVELAVNGDEPFPMASVFKLPVLVELFAKAKAGDLDWDDEIDVGPRDQHIGSGDLSYDYDPPGIELSLRNVANLMMIESDNSAADICLRIAGVGDVNARMRALGLSGIRVDRSAQELILDYQGRETATLKDLPFGELVTRLAPSPSPASTVEGRFGADDRYAADPRDTATPRALMALLEKIWRGEAVDPESSAAMLEVMKRCQTGRGRLPGLLPPGTDVAHKTGTMGGAIADVGILYLPDGAGHVAIAVLTKRTRSASADVERAIAEIARFAYDYFLFRD